MKIAILGAADIAFRRFLPALMKQTDIVYAGTASRVPEKAKRFAENFGGIVYPSYDAVLEDESVDAVYVPLPPALHFQWGKKVLLAGKNLFMEKPFTTSLQETQQLLSLARERGLAVHENYMFLYHKQLSEIKKLLANGTVGDIRRYNISFGFPKREPDDFRYSRALGGGALLDCGGYPVRLALELLGDTAHVTQSALVQPEGYEVDLFGSAALENDQGLTAQLSFGMDNAYRCCLEVWGSKAVLTASRVFTAPVDFDAEIAVTEGKTDKTSFVRDDAFLKSITYFYRLCGCAELRKEAAETIRKQSGLTEAIRTNGIHILV